MSEGHRGTEGRQNGTRKEGEEKTKKNRRGGGDKDDDAGRTDDRVPQKEGHARTTEAWLKDWVRDISVQGSAKRWSLGCVNSASWLPLDAGGGFTQPRDHSLAQPCT